MAPVNPPRDQSSFESRTAESTEVRTQLEKLLQSAAFSKSKVLKKFVSHIVERRLAGEVDALNEHRLGMELFQRDNTFDPERDSIVRVHARRLRLRLDKYYKTEGKDDAILISLHRYNYVPQFAVRGLDEEALRSVVQPTERQSDSNSVVVVPFVNLSHDPGLELLAEGLAEDLILHLSGIPELSVVSRTSSIGYRNSDKTLKEIAQELGIESAIEGSVRRIGNNVRVVIRLVDAQTDRQLWSETYERQIHSVMGLGGDLALRIAASLNKHVSEERRQRIRSRVTSSYAAYDLYLRGRSLLRKYERTHIKEAIRIFEEAIAKDQKFAGAYAGLADAYCSLIYGHQLAPSQGLTLASKAVKRALAIDPGHVGALTALGFVRLLGFKWESAEEAFRHAVVAGPGYAPSYFGLGVFLTLRGRFDEGLAELKKSQQLEPFSPLVFLHLALNHLWRQEYGAALREARRAAELAPGWPPAYSLIPLIQVHEQRNFDALSSLDSIGNPGERFPFAAAVRGYAYAMAGRARSAREVLLELQGTADREYDPNIIGRAAIHVALCEDELALSLLEQAWKQGDPGLLLLRFAPAWRPLHGNRRFQTLLERIG